MRRIAARLTLTLVALTLLAACGSGGPGSAGPITLPTVPPVDTTAVDTTIPPVTTTRPAGASTSTTDPAETTTSTTTATDTTVPAATSTISVYFVEGTSNAAATSRTAPVNEVAATAVAALIAGPTEAERARGLSTQFPPDSLLLGLRIADGTATVDMSREFEAGGGSFSMLARLAQLVYTLTDFPTVDRVQLLLDGEHRQTFSGEGVLIGEPMTRDDFFSALPIGRLVAATPVWGPDDLPALDPAASTTRSVVLVTGDDTLNVRATAGVDGKIIGELRPGSTINSTGQTQQVGSSTWEQIQTPAGKGWVNALYLNRRQGIDEDDVTDLVIELADRFDRGEPFADLISAKGLWVAHHATPIRFTRADLDGILASPTTYRWGSNALDADSPEIRPRTFRQAIADRFAGVLLDSDTVLHFNTAIEGPNGRPIPYAVPIEFTGFDYVFAFDPGDDPQYGGIDWTSWLVSVTREGSGYKVVGLTIDEWSP